MAARKKSAPKKVSKKKAAKRKAAPKKKSAAKKRATFKKKAVRRPVAKKKGAARRPAAKKKAPAGRKAPAKKAAGLLDRIAAVFRPAANAPLTFITESLPQFTVGRAKKVSIEASGGQPPYAFALVQGTLPPNLQLNAKGTLFGTVQSADDDTTIFVEVRDSARPPAQLTQAFDLQIEPA
ncbi:MAG TPA: putative Ig domain-containing protein [Burkholderiales bacterium]|nr:putative Ig domain-containing protein [Burkholderiales bacterium]